MKEQLPSASLFFRRGPRSPGALKRRGLPGRREDGGAGRGSWEKEPVLHLGQESREMQSEKKNNHLPQD